MALFARVHDLGKVEQSASVLPLNSAVGVLHEVVATSAHHQRFSLGKVRNYHYHGAKRLGWDGRDPSKWRLSGCWGCDLRRWGVGLLSERRCCEDGRNAEYGEELRIKLHRVTLSNIPVGELASTLSCLTGAKALNVDAHQEDPPYLYGGDVFPQRAPVRFFKGNRELSQRAWPMLEADPHQTIPANASLLRDDVANDLDSPLRQ